MEVDQKIDLKNDVLTKDQSKINTLFDIYQSQTALFKTFFPNPVASTSLIDKFSHGNTSLCKSLSLKQILPSAITTKQKSNKS